MLAGRLEGHLRAGGSSPFPSMAMCEPAWGPWGWGPWVSLSPPAPWSWVCAGRPVLPTYYSKS